MKTCYKCSVEKPLDAFGNNKSKKDGKATECKECKREMDNKYSAQHREESRKKASEWYYNNLDRAKATKKIVSSRWVRENKDKNCAKAARYRAGKLKATPPWLTEEDMHSIQVEYSLALWTSEVMGQEYHVDHIVPLKGKLVCGLHVPWNLQVIPALENQSKGNRHHVL